MTSTPKQYDLRPDWMKPSFKPANVAVTATVDADADATSYDAYEYRPEDPDIYYEQLYNERLTALYGSYDELDAELHPWYYF